MFALADKYDIPRLSALAHAKYQLRLQNSWDPAEFLQSVPDVYEMTPTSIRLLRDEVAKCARVKLEKALKSADMEPIYEDVVENVPGFTRDVLRLHIRAPLQGDCVSCGPEQPMRALQARCARCGRGRELSAY